MDLSKFIPKKKTPIDESTRIDPIANRKAELNDTARVQDLRDRLYARGTAPRGVEHHQVPPHLSPTAQVSTSFSPTSETPASEVPQAVQNAISYTGTIVKKKHTIRKVMALVGVIFFVGAAAVASLLMLSGNNIISGQNITVNVIGQIASGGGDVLPFQVSIANQNATPIQGATLIIEYPKGTKDPETGKELTTERRQLDVVKAGELINVELKARVFGEENEEKEIRVSVDYRIEGSGATFHKDAEPFKFKISTSPVVATFNALKAVATGQEYTLELVVQSNTTLPLTDVLVKMSYPNGFDYTNATPAPVSGEDVWRIKELKPGDKKVITVKGVVTGYQDDVRKFIATVGVGEGNNSTALTSLLAQTETEATVERPFLDTTIKVNGVLGSPVIVDKNDTVTVDIYFENTLDTIIYDAKIIVSVEGNAVNERNIRSSEGYYDSGKNTITWDGTDSITLKEILPGEDGKVSFSISQEREVESAPTLNLSVTVRGQRVFEDDVPKQLESVTKQVINIESKATLATKVFYNTGPFENDGPLPPVVEKTTKYTIEFNLKTGNNDLSKTEMIAELPPYMEWLNAVTEGDNVTYNPNSRMIKWLPGDMKANTNTSASVQVAFTPSEIHIQKFPQLLGRQYFTAIDTHTNTDVKDSSAPVTTIIEESDGAQNGQVRAHE